ncbi:MAG: hypothetical protein RLZ22_533 [Verrucomicrobiota bacterium]|jgi:DNA-binding phage protein
MLEDYNQRQAQADQEYAREYASWLDSMTQEEREQLEALGLGEAEMPRRSGNVGLSRDAAKHNSAACLDEIAQPDPDETISEADLRTCEVIQKLLAELLADKNPALAVECLALVSGVAYSGNSMVSLARRHGLTRAAVSKRCIELAERIGVKNPRPMKTEHAREIYRERAVEVHRREGREITSEPQRAARIETMGSHASRIAGIWARVRKSDWIKSATPAELLLCRRSLRPVFAIANELARLIRSKNDPIITAQLEADMGALS